MGKLSVLGAQRVKALIEVLNDKEREEIRKLNAQMLSEEGAEKIVREELGASELYKEIDEIEKRIKEVSAELEAKTGYYVSISVGYQSWKNEPYREYTRRLNEVRGNGVDKQIEQLKKEYRAKEQMLWLCETLEEAKAIVGIQ